MRRLLCLALFFACKTPPTLNPPKELPSTTPTVALSTLEAGQEAHGFKATARYQDQQEQPIGARFVHQETGFTLDLLQLQSSPQAFVWVNSMPTSDKGEPHTQEHLLLGKGDKGRALANAQSMSLVESSAFTMQQRTAYHFQTVAGPEVFYQSLSTLLDAMLHPDYTDEEIRREVRNFGVAKDPKSGRLHIEEQGTVYQEMSSTYAGPSSRLYDALGRMLYGSKHPLSFSAGGTPEALRTLSPKDIRDFHQQNYHLDQMGVIAALPKEMTLDEVLARVDKMLHNEGATTKTSMPKPAPTTPGEIKIVEYPNENAQQPGDLIFAWPAPPTLSTNDRLLLELFLAAFSGDATTTLYKRFVDVKTKTFEIGAQGVFSFTDDESQETTPIYLGISSLAPTHLTEPEIKQLRGAVTEELQRLAALPAGDPALNEFNERVRGQILQTRRSLSKLSDSPPGFGFRNTGPQWMYHLDAINRQGGFVKSLTWRSELTEIEALLDKSENPWTPALSSWGMLEVAPYAVGVRANPALIASEEEALKERSRAEVARLVTKYGATDEQAALARYQEDYAAETATLEVKSTKQATLRFIDNPPMTLDDTLDYSVKKLRGDVVMVASTFESMQSTTTGLALNLRGIPEEQLLYVSLLPALMTRVGVIESGVPVSFEDMSARLRREVLSVSATFDADLRTRRVELVLKGAGNSLEESKNALSWMKLMLTSPDWRPENLPRIREAVNQSLSRLRERPLGPEESWVNDPADAYWSQDDPLLLSTSSFMTRAFNAVRLRWLLKDAGSKADQEALQKFCKDLPLMSSFTREMLVNFLSELSSRDEKTKIKLSPKIEPNKKQYVLASFDALSSTARPLAKELSADLSMLLSDIPDETLNRDFHELTARLTKDLMTPPAEALASLQSLREGLLLTGNARLFQIGSSASQEALSSPLDVLLSSLRVGEASPVVYQDQRWIEARLLEHSTKRGPRFVGLVAPSLQGGVFLNYVPSTSYLDTQREPLLRYLSSRLYAGHGAHGIFMKTWGAGLAYSNGMRGSLREGRLAYYAERTPLLPQTMSFVIKTLQDVTPDQNLVEYALAMIFKESRAAASYEARGEAIAKDLTDGVGPAVVKKFRENILALHQESGLLGELSSRMKEVYATLLPGYAERSSETRGAVYFVIGQEKQLSAYEEYLKSAVAPDAVLYRLYPRDFWRL